MTTDIEIPQEIFDTAALLNLTPTEENACAFLDVIGRFLVRELVAKAVADAMEAMIADGLQAGGVVETPWPRGTFEERDD